MFQRRKRHGVPPLNTTSTADISFMLLIFFLVTTSMGADKGLRRELPPLNEKEEQTAAVREEAMMHVVIGADGRVVCNGQAVAMPKLKATFKDFIDSKGLEHTFELSSDPRATYDAYYHVQNALQTAYRELRDERARATYKRSFEQLTDAQKESIAKAIPQRIAENYEASAATNTAGAAENETGKEAQP